MEGLLGFSLLTIHRPPPSLKNDNLGLLQIRILHLRKRREKSFPTVKMFLVLKLCRFKVVNLPLMDLVIFRGRTYFPFIIAARTLIFGPSR